MNFEIFEKGPCPDEILYTQRKDQYRFSDYMANFWGVYTKGQAEDDPQVIHALCSFFNCSQKCVAIRQIFVLRLVSALRGFPLLAKHEWHGWTPLHTVAFQGLNIFYEKIVRARKECWPIEFGTPHSVDPRGSTPLITAAAQGHPALARLLIEDGAAVAAEGEFQNNSLHGAARGGHSEVSKILLENGVEINRKNGIGETALHLAARGGHVELVKLLLDKDNSEINSGLETPVHLAAKGGHVQVVKLLLDNGAEIESYGLNQETPLHLAAVQGYYELAKSLLEKGVEINIKEGLDKMTPLHIAARGGHIQLGKLLVDNDAEINENNYKGQTPFHLAATEGHIACAIVMALVNLTVLKGREESRDDCELIVPCSLL
jgi:ankyrin repeat protein